MAPSATSLSAYQTIRDHVAKGALSMIDWANHKPANRGQKPKVGGHQASSMSSVDLLAALYLDALRPGDRVAVKPHAAPVLYALMHCLGLVSTDQMGTLREYKGLQPYPTELKNPRFVDYTTSSEALGVACTIYDAYGAKHHDRALAPALGRRATTALYWAHCGDGELTEGQIDESLYDAGRWQLDNLVWIVDLNRQSLDRVMDDSGQLAGWAARKFRGHGWQVCEARWGSRAEALFARPGGAELRALLESLDDARFHPLLVVSPETLVKILTGETADERPAIARLLADYRAALSLGDDARAGLRRVVEAVAPADLADGIRHLGGHDLELLCRRYAEARAALADGGGPICLVAHTLKGYETSGAGHPENHGGLLPTAEVAAWGTPGSALDRGLPAGVAYPVPAADSEAGRLLARRAAELFEADAHSYVPAPLDVRRVVAGVTQRARTVVSTGEIFQSLNLALTRTALGPYLQFGAPDVGQTTHLGPVIKQTGVFAPRDLPDTWAWMREEGLLSFDWRPSPSGQFHAFGIAEGNAMLWAYAFGRRKKAIEGKLPLLPVVTVYDKFFERGLNQLDYAVYSNARFIAVGVPSGTGLSRETATHQSIQTLRMMMDLPGLMTYEPAFAADLHAIYLHALGRLWDDAGEAFYLRLTTQPVEQPAELPEGHAELAVRGGYWLVGDDDRRGVGDGTRAPVLLVASGRKLEQVRQAARILAERGIGSRILNVTSYEALWREWDAFANDPSAWDDPARSYHLHDLFDEATLNAPLVIVGDHVASVAEWLPTALQRVRGHRFLGPRKNGEAGDLASIDHLHGMGVADIVRVAEEELAWRAGLRTTA
ncbi:MAG: hypothetical protein U1F43_11655 [Myxococcota bacterium]